MAIIHFTEQTFQQDVIESKKTTLVDFFATWCGPCKMLAPILEDVAGQAGEAVTIGKVDIDECAGLAQNYEVMSVPTLILFKDGKEEKRVVGLQSKQALLSLIEQA